MNYKAVLSSVATATLVACGGGGGGDGGAAAPAAPSAVQITESNAKPVGAHATATAQDASAAQSTSNAGLLAGVQVEGSGAAVPDLRAITALAQLGARAGGTGAMAAGVSTTDNCPGGGTITASGTVASESGLSAGDSATIAASNCSVDGVTLNGSLSLQVVSGSMSSGATTFHIVLSLVADKLSVKTSSQTTTTTGDLKLDWNATSASTGTITASGASLSTSLTNASGTRTTTLRDYSQTIVTNGTALTGRMSASVTSTSTVLGSSGGAYTVSTPTDLAWTTTNPNPTAGVVKVVGANNSQLRVTYSANAVVLEVDANGDGTYEKTINTTASELKGLL